MLKNANFTKNGGNLARGLPNVAFPTCSGEVEDSPKRENVDNSPIMVNFMLKSANVTTNGGIHPKNAILCNSMNFGEFHLNYLVKSMC